MGGNGVTIENGASGNDIGGDPPPDPVTENASMIEPTGMVIANNGGAGVAILPSAGTGNQIRSVSISGNAGLGIDFGGSGHTPNDPGDADVGPNKLQNYPLITSKQVVGDELILSFNVDSAPEHSAYGSNGIYVEFFKADSSGEGQTFLGSTFYALADYQSGSPGTKTVNLGPLATLGITESDKIVATATDADGNTSEFSPMLGPNAAHVTVSGRVMSGQRPIASAILRMSDPNGNSTAARTNAFGYFRFDGVPAGETYVLSITARGHSFPAMVLSVSDNVSDLIITSTGRR